MSDIPKNYYEMMEELQAIDFVLVELTLYLDTHPGDNQAIQQFNAYSQHRRMLKERFEAAFGPLQQYGNSYSNYPWDWNDLPWPWEV
jgi:spore coat protein JB